MKIDVRIPEKLSELTLKQYQQILAIDPESEKEFYNRRVLNIIYHIDGAQYNKLKSKDVAMLLDEATKLLNEKPKLVRRFKDEKTEYGLIPNFDDITMGELVDIDNHSSAEKYHLLMSILYRPIIAEQMGERYAIAKYTGVKDMSWIPANIAIGVLGFFLTIGEQLTNDILSSLTEEEMEQVRKLDFLKNGDGTPPSMPSVMEILQKQTL